MLGKKGNCPWRKSAGQPTFKPRRGFSGGDSRKAAERLLKGQPFETLRIQTYEDIMLEPIYHAADSAGSRFLPARTSADWRIVQSIRLPGPTEFNSAVRSALQMGQTGVNLALYGAGCQGMDGAQLIEAGGAAISTAGVGAPVPPSEKWNRVSAFESAQSAPGSSGFFATTIAAEPAV